MIESIKVVYEDPQLLIVNKPAGMLSQSSKDEENNALDLLEVNRKIRLFPINRLDRPCSGILMMSKDKHVAAYYSTHWSDETTVKTYLAICSHALPAEEGYYVDQLYHDRKHHKSRIEPDYEDAKTAKLSYKLQMVLDNYWVYAIELHTGRFHQIRAQLAHHGAVIKGDVKYGARRSNRDRSIGLHAWKLETVSEAGEKQKWIANLPKNDIWPVINAQLKS